MGAGTKIEWATHTFNPWVGCTKVSPACDHCYAEGWAKRAGSPELWQGERRRTSESYWKQPLKWNVEAVKLKSRPRVFCASLADVFDNQVPEQWRADLWEVIASTPNLDWLLLTKRPQNIAKMLPPLWPEPNVWLGTTVENQEEAGRRIPHLLAVPAVVHFLSCEPLLGPVNLAPFGHVVADGIAFGFDWVIAGGESGPGARPSNPDWFRWLRDECADAGTAFFFKQHGEWGVECMPPVYDSHRWPIKPDELEGGVWSYRVGKKRAGRLLDGTEHNAVPHDRHRTRHLPRHRQREEPRSNPGGGDAGSADDIRDHGEDRARG